MMDVYTEWSGDPSQLGEVSINLEDGSYGVAYIGNGPTISRYLTEQEFFGLAARVRRIRRFIAYFSAVEVSTDIRRKGTGSAMVEAILKELQSLEISKVFLHASGSAHIDQEALEEWWRKRGFQVEPCCDKDIWTVMTRKL